MKSLLFLCLFFSLELFSQSFFEILQDTQYNTKIKALQHRQDAQNAQAQAQFAYEAPSLSLDLGSAKDVFGHRDLEYALSLSQELQTPFATEAKKSAQRAIAHSLRSAKEYEYNSFVLDLGLSYHLACVDKERFLLMQDLASGQKKALEKLGVAYEAGEISRKDLLFHRVEYLKIKEQESAFLRRYKRSVFDLQMQAQSGAIENLACSDMIEPSMQDFYIQMQKNTKLQTLSFKRDAAALHYELSKDPLQSLSYSLSYQKELDKKRYGLVLSFPLSFLTSKQEQEQSHYLHTQSALDEELHLLEYELKQNMHSLRTQLHSNYASYQRYQEEILPLSQELQELSSLALAEGEGSVIESLDATRSYLHNTLEMLEKKKEYYEALFALYKITEKQLGEMR